MLCQIFGSFPKSVISVRNDNCITAIFRYSAYDVTAIFSEMNISESYYVLRIGKKECSATSVKIENKHFREELYNFYKLLKNGEESVGLTDFFAPVYILEALERSLKSGKEEKIKLHLEDCQ